MRFKDEKGKLIKSIVLVLCILCAAMVIIALQFADARYMLTKSYETELYFYEYRIKETEIVLSTEKYTGEDITVEIKTQIPGLSIQYQLGDDGEWIDYVGPFSVSENIKLNTRLVSDEDRFISSVTSKEIKNIAVAKIGDEYFKTLAAAIDACAENAGDNKTKIEMLINVKENIVIPEGKNIELDLCGATLEGKDSKDETITVSGKFTLIDSAQNEDGTLQGNGKVLSAGAEAVHVLANGEFVLGTNESATGANEEISIINPVIEGKTYGVKVEDNGNFKFYDGIIIGADDKSVSGKTSDTPTGYRVVNGTKKIDGTTYETSYLDNTYHVTFDENYENAKTTKKDIKYNTAIGELSEPTREKYIFDGWYTAKTGGEKITKETVITEDTTFYAYWLEVVASTTIGDVTTNYASVQQAINAAGTNVGATVTLLKDEIAETVTVATGQDIVIDLNGKTWANIGAQTITNNGKLTIDGEGTLTSSNTYTILNNGTFEKFGTGVIEYTGSGTESIALKNRGIINLYEGTIISSNIGVENTGSGKIIIDGITIQSTGNTIRNIVANTESETLSNPSVMIKSGVIESSNSNGVRCAANRVIDIQGGTIKGTTAIQMANNAIVNITDARIEGNDGINNYDNGQLYINKGSTIIGNKTRGIVNLRDGIVTVTGGTITGEVYGIQEQAQDGLIGTVIITGGTIIGKSQGIAVGKANVIIGTDDGKVDTGKPVIVSEDTGILNPSGTFEFYDGIIKGIDGKSISGTVSKISDGYYIEKGKETIDGVEYETSYLARRNYEVTEGATLADVVQVGDFVSYDASSNGVKTFTTADCLAGSSISDTISTANAFNSSAPAQWRVLSVDKETGVVELMAADPTAQTVTLSGGDGFVNAETVLNNIGAIYGSGKGATGGRSVTKTDFSGYSHFDYLHAKFEYSNTGYYGGTREYTRGDHYKEIKDEYGNVVGYETVKTTATEDNPIAMTQTEYGITINHIEYLAMRNLIFRSSTNINESKPNYWLASQSVFLDDTHCLYAVGRVNVEGNNIGKTYVYYNNQNDTKTQNFVPVVTLQTNIKTTGKDANGAWQLSFEETTQEPKYYSTLQSAIENSKAGSTIKVLNDTEETKAPTVPVDKGLTLDLSGKTIALNGVSLTNNGGLTITGEGTLTSANADTIVNSGRLKKSGNGTIENTSEDKVAISNTGMVTLLEGTIEGAKTAISTTSGMLTLGVNDGTVKVDNPTIKGADTGVSVTGGKFNVYDGNVKGTIGKSIVGQVSDVATQHAIVKAIVDAIETALLKQEYLIKYDANGGKTAPEKQYKIHEQDLTLTSEILTKDYYVFKGWATTKDAIEVEYEPGATYTKNEKATLYAVWVEATASTTVGEETTYYETVQQAINAAGTNQGAIVTLLKDEIAEDVTVASGQNIILDVNGKNLKNATATYTIANIGELTIIGEGTIFGDSSRATIKCSGTGKTILDGNCTIVATNRYTVSNESIFILNNGTIISEISHGIYNYAGATTKINNAIIQGANYGISNSGNLTISDGEIVGVTGGICVDRGNVTITGGSVRGDFAIYNGVNGNVKITGGEFISNLRLGSMGNLEITGGRFVGKQYGIAIGGDAVLTIGTNEENPLVDITNPVIIGESYGIFSEDNSTINFYDGIIMGPASKIILGDIADIPDGYYIEKGKEIVDGVEYETSYLALNIDAAASTTIGTATTYYETVQEAINAAGTNENAKVRLLKESITETITVQEGQDIILDLNGKTLTYSAKSTFINHGTVEIIGEGTLNGAGANSVHTITNYGVLTKNGNGKLTNTSNNGNYVLNNVNTGIFTFNEGEITAVDRGLHNASTASIIITGGKLSTADYAIYNMSNANTVESPAIKITGGEITSTLTNAIHNDSTGTILVAGGTINGKTGIHNGKSGSGTIILGVDEEMPEVSVEQPRIVGTNYGVYANGAKFKYYDGVIIGGTAKSIGGVVTDMPAVHVVGKGTETINGTVYEKSYLQYFAAASTTIDDETTYFTTVQAAVDHAGTNEGAKVTLLEDMTETVTVAEEQNITFDLNGKTLDYSATSTLINYGTLEITGDGKIDGSGANSVHTITNHGTLTKNGNGILSNTSNNGNYVVNNIKTGTFIFNEGEITAVDRGVHNSYSTTANGVFIMTGGKITSADYAIYNMSAASSEESPAIKITGGEIVSTEVVGIFNDNPGRVVVENANITAYSHGISSDNSGTIEIRNSNITSTNAWGVANTSSGTVNVYDSTIKGYVHGISNASSGSGKLNIYSGTIIGETNDGIGTGAGTLTIGTDDGSVSETEPYIKGERYGIYKQSSSAKIYFYDGIIVSTQGNSITGPVTNQSTGFTVTKTKDSDGVETAFLQAVQATSVMSLRLNIEEAKTNTGQLNNNEVTKNETILNTSQPANIIQISDNYYTTIKEAINAANTGDTLKLLEDITLTEEVVIAKDKNIKLDLNNKTLTSTNKNTLTNNGTLKILGKGSVTNKVKDGNVIYNTGTLNIENGVIKVSKDGGKAVYNDATLQITGGKIIISADDAVGIYNSDKATKCIIKDAEIFIEAEEIENYEKIKNTDEFKAELEEKKPSYGIYNNSLINVEIKTATIKVERLKSVGIMNKANGTITLGVKDSEVSTASPTIYAIEDTTTAIINSGKGKINFYDGKFSTLNSVKDIITEVSANYEIIEEAEGNILNTTLQLIEVVEDIKTEEKEDIETSETIEEKNETEVAEKSQKTEDSEIIEEVEITKKIEAIDTTEKIEATEPKGNKEEDLEE